MARRVLPAFLTLFFLGVIPVMGHAQEVPDEPGVLIPEHNDEAVNPSKGESLMRVDLNSPDCTPFCKAATLKDQDQTTQSSTSGADSSKKAQ